MTRQSHYRRWDTRFHARLRAEPLEGRFAPSGVPVLDSWLKASPGQNALAVSGYNVAAGATTTWPTGVPTGAKYFGGVTTPTLGDIQQVRYSANWAYVNAPGLAGYAMGPWFFEDGSVFPNFPANQNKLVRITRSPQPATTHSANGLGSVGIWVNGVSMFNMLDAFSWDVGTFSDLPTGKGGDGVWNRDANAAEGPTFDHSHAHQPESGEYHYHANPTALRAILNDNIAYHGSANTFPYDPNVLVEPPVAGDEHPYHEHTESLHHSPILGWSYDGYPVYGPYGYSNPNDASSPIQRMASGYRLRNISTRTSLPGWAAKVQFGDGVALNASGEYTLASVQYGPAVNATRPIGWYTEDYEYVTGLGTLDAYNGRFTKTPEFPNGTYAYFISIDAAGEEAFPYVIGRQYYGQVTSGKVTSITESATSYFDIAAPQNGGTVRGVVYTDANGDGTRSFNELSLANVTAYIDADKSGTLNGADTSAQTGIDGSFELPVAASGSVLVRTETPPGMILTTANSAAVTVSGGNPVAGVAFGLRASPPTVTGVQINDGSAQRSRVVSVFVNFSEAVSFPASVGSAFKLERTNGSSTGVVNLTAVQNGSSVNLTVANGGAIGLDGTSLDDGLYQLTVIAANVLGAGGTPAADALTTFHRLFGDADGDRDVDVTDFGVFRTAYGSNAFAFDADGDGDVDGSDFGRFRAAFGSTI